MTKFKMDTEGPYYTIFHGKNMLDALKEMRHENQKIMDTWKPSDPMCKFWRVIRGVRQKDRTDLLCQLDLR